MSGKTSTPETGKYIRAFFFHYPPTPIRRRFLASPQPHFFTPMPFGSPTPQPQPPRTFQVGRRKPALPPAGFFRPALPFPHNHLGKTEFFRLAALLSICVRLATLANADASRPSGRWRKLFFRRGWTLSSCPSGKKAQQRRQTEKISLSPGTTSGLGALHQPTRRVPQDPEKGGRCGWRRGSWGWPR